MGDTPSTQNQNNLSQKLDLVQKTQDPNFGYISIYRLKQPPYDYIMAYSKTFMDGDTRYQAYDIFLSQLRQKQHKNLVKIHMSQIHKQSHVCIKDIKVHTFCNYYNFTLKQAIGKKKNKGTQFSQSQLIYIMCCLLDLSVFLKNHGIVLGDYRSSKIFLSPEGYIKVYTLEIQHQNKHTSYYKALVDRSLIEQLTLSPEQLLQLQKLQYNPTYDIYKSDLFAIAMIILQLMTLDPIKFYYTQDKTNLKIGRINFDITSFTTQYSRQFLDILRDSLTQNQRQRSTLQSAFNRLYQLRNKSQNISYCIRLHQEDSLKKQTNHQIKRQHILPRIQKKLTPSPITTHVSSTHYYFSPQNYDKSKQILS